MKIMSYLCASAVLIFFYGCGNGSVSTHKEYLTKNCGNGELDEGEVCDGNVGQCAEIAPELFITGKAKCLKDCSGWDLDTCVEKSDADDTDTVENDNDTGNTANTGDSGDTGDTGDTSDSGDTGDTGNTGNSGDTADTGDTGNTGDTGEDWSGHPCFQRLEDKDGDGLSNELECPEFPCQDTDKDAFEDCQDIDSDGDGLGDVQELFCVNIGKHTNFSADTDEDGYSDLEEVLLGSDPCNSENGLDDIDAGIYFILPFGGSQETKSADLHPSVKKSDIIFNIDTTGSMGGSIAALKNSLSGTIIPSVRNVIADSAFGVTQFRDENEVTLLVTQPVTDIVTAQNGVNTLAAAGGGDTPEAGYWSLKTSVTDLSFRDGILPVYVHVTDAESHERGATKAEALAALGSVGARVVTILTNSTATAALTQLTEISTVTNAVVPECSGAGRTVLQYTVSSDGTGFNDAVTDGIEYLVKYSPFSIYADAVKGEYTESVETACFIKKIEADQFIASDECVLEAAKYDHGSTGYYNGFSNFATGTSNSVDPGSKIRFNVYAQNSTCFPAYDEAKLFKVKINAIEEITGSVFDSIEVSIIVPVE